MRYYDTGSVYESPEARRLHQAPDLLGLAGGTEGRLVAGQLRIRAPRLRGPEPPLLRLTMDGVVASGSRSAPPSAYQPRPGRARPAGTRRAASMTTFLLVLAEPAVSQNWGDPLSLASDRRDRDAVVAAISRRVEVALGAADPHPAPSGWNSRSALGTGPRPLLARSPTPRFGRRPAVIPSVGDGSGRATSGLT